MTIITSRLPSPPSTLPFALAERGDAVIAERLAAALRSQWAWGFPTVPKPAPQLTHGFYQYPAGMQPVAAEKRIVQVRCGAHSISAVAGARF